MSLSVLMISRNVEKLVGEALASVNGLWDELLVGDAGSTDGTAGIVEKYGGRLIKQRGSNLGKRKQELVEKAKSNWILVLDSDERVSPELAREIKRTVRPAFGNQEIVAHRIPYQNYVFGKPVYYGGEKYSKVRLFRKEFGKVATVPLHEEIVIRGKIGQLFGVIHHHSYRTPWQLFTKFTKYARLDAKLKHAAGEKVTWQKIFLYGPHLFWARFVQDKGYRDGWRGLILAFAFGYLEGLTYCFLFFRKILLR